MALLDDLGYRHGPANRLQHAVQTVAASPPGAWAMSRILPLVDRLALRLTRGQTSACQVLGGLPVLWLTTTGARSGRPRTTPLLGVPLGEAVAVAAANFAQGPMPAWVHNLDARPQATVAYRSRRVAVTARRASPDEAAEVFELAARIYPGSANYRRRLRTRGLPVFVLEPTAEPAAAPPAVW